MSEQSDQHISAELGLVEQTARNYITNIYGKLGVHSWAEVVVWARPGPCFCVQAGAVHPDQGFLPLVTPYLYLFRLPLVCVTLF